MADTPSIPQRLETVDWGRVGAALDENGFATLPQLLTPEECDSVAAMYADDARFRSRVVMARHNFGEGEYKYFANPLPSVVGQLRESLYPFLATTANRWAAMLEGGPTLGGTPAYPDSLAEFAEVCRRHGQHKPTPLVLHYLEGGYNCLHQDIYGDIAFPLQVVFMLSRKDRDYTGGELLLVEQRPRAQSRGNVVTLDQGEGLVFTTRDRPVRGSRGYYRGTMRHGVSRIHTGERFTLGIIFHDAA